MKMRFILLGPLLMLFFSTKTIAQQKSNDNTDSITNAMYAVIDDSLSKYDIETDARNEINKMIETADSAYKKGIPNLQNYELIVGNFRKLVHKIGVYVIVLHGMLGGDAYAIFGKSINLAKKDVCPLYPFCKEKSK